MVGGDADRSKLVDWLNGGALNAAREQARPPARPGSDQTITTLYHDERPDRRQPGSHGYVYVVGYLYEHFG